MASALWDQKTMASASCYRVLSLSLGRGGIMMDTD